MNVLNLCLNEVYFHFNMINDDTKELKPMGNLYFPVFKSVWRIYSYISYCFHGVIIRRGVVMFQCIYKKVSSKLKFAIFEGGKYLILEEYSALLKKTQIKVF